MNFLMRWAGAGRISERDRRTLILGVAIVLGLITVFRGIPAWRTWVTANQALAISRTNRLAIVRQSTNRIGETSRYTDSLARLTIGVAPALVDGNSPAQATAALASYLSDVAANAGVQLSGVQLTVDSTKKGAELYRVRVQADGSGDIRGMTTLFHLLEDGNAPLVNVKAFSISQTDPGAPANHAETLHATFELEALAQRADD